MKKIIFCLFALFCGAGFVWSGNAVAYVSTTGSDANDGTFSRPYRTIRKALEETSADATLVIRDGDYHEAINISQKPGRRSLLIKAYAGERVRLLGGQCVDKAEPLPGYRKVLKARAGLPSTSPHYRIFQHDVDDPSTLVPPTEHHPLQRGKAYRCSSLPLARVASIEAVEAASSPSYYYDESAGFLYFSLAEGTDLAGHPLYLPGGKGVYGGNDAVNTADYDRIEMGRFLTWTSYPVYRFPADIIHWGNASQEFVGRSPFNAETLLFDIEADYAQENPIEDEQLEAACAAQMKKCMEQCDAPVEQFERMGF